MELNLYLIAAVNGSALVSIGMNHSRKAYLDMCLLLLLFLLLLW